MARLKNCRTCGSAVAKNAIGCPTCGRGNPAPGLIRKTLTTIITLVVLGVLLAAVVIGVAMSNGS